MLSFNKVSVVDPKYTLFVRLHIYVMEQFNGSFIEFSSVLILSVVYLQTVRACEVGILKKQTN